MVRFAASTRPFEAPVVWGARISSRDRQVDQETQACCHALPRSMSNDPPFRLSTDRIDA
jgi:hypothetical protein